MGEVYWAQAARLGRDVALKVLPEVFAGDAQRIVHFEREANSSLPLTIRTSPPFTVSKKATARCALVVENWAAELMKK